MNLFQHNRKRIITWLFNRAQHIYTNYLKRSEPWTVTKAELLAMPHNTLGYNLGKFLLKNGFDMIPRAERHDAYHVVTGYSTDVQDEIAQQYLCLANGKRSPFLFGVITVGTLLLPEFLPYYLKSFVKGREMATFHHYDYEQLLHYDLQEFKKGLIKSRTFGYLHTSELEELKPGVLAK